MSNLIHWHKPTDEAAEYVDPPTCCTARFQQLTEQRIRAAGDTQDQAVHAERKRVILAAAERLEAFAAEEAV